MALFNVNTGARLAVEFQLGTSSRDEHVNVLHFAKRDGSQMTRANLISLTDDFKANIMELYRGMFYTSTTGVVIRAETIFPEPREGVQGGGTYNGSRAIVGEPMPPWVCMKIKWGVGYLTRRWRGRSYIGGLYEQDQAAGFATQAHMDKVTAFAGIMITRYGASSILTPYTFCILSDPDGLLPDATSVVGKETPMLAAVESYTVNNQLTSLRRRMK